MEGIVELISVSDSVHLLASLITALSVVGGFILYLHRSMSLPKRRAWDIVEKFDLDKNFFEARAEFQKAVDNPELSYPKKDEKTQSDDGTEIHAYVAPRRIYEDKPISYLLNIYEHWAMLIRDNKINRAVIRRYVGYRMVADIESVKEWLDMQDPYGDYWQESRWFVVWWRKNRKKSDFQ